MSRLHSDGRSLVVFADHHVEGTSQKCFLLFSAQHEAEAYRDALVPGGEIFEAPNEAVLADYLEGLHEREQINYAGIDPPIQPDGSRSIIYTADIKQLIAWLRHAV